MMTSRLLTERNLNDRKVILDVPGDYLHSALLISQEVINQVVELSGETLYENYLTKKSIPFTVSLTLKSIISIVELRNIRKEPLETDSIVEDLEPLPSPIDTWARSFVPVIQKTKLTRPTPIIKPPSDTKSVSTLRSRRSTSRFKNKTSKTNKTVVDSFTIIEGPTPIQISEHIEDSDEEIESLRRRKDFEVQKKRADHDREKTLKIQENELSQKLLKEVELLKNKQYTHDYKGKLIIITKPELEDIFEVNTPLRYTSVDPPTNSKSLKVMKKPTPHLSTLKKSIKTQAEEKIWVRNMILKSSPLMDNISLNPNVTLSDGQKTKLPPKESSEKMSRKNYFSSVNPPVLSTKKSSSISSMSSFKKEVLSRKDFFESVPDYQDSPKTPILTVGFSHKSVSPINKVSQGRITSYGPHLKLIPTTPQELFNLEIIQNQAWGTNPPPRTPKLVKQVPLKLNPNQMREIFGNIAKKPKDQPFVAPEELWKSQSEMIKKPKDRRYIDKVVKKKKNPPPPFGYTMLNGIEELGGRE